VPENFDIGPLTWVKDEIFQSLDTVLEHLTTVQHNIHDTSPFKLSQLQLYQASGALDMVGLEGCKRYCNELEKLASKLEKQLIVTTPEILTLLGDGISTLRQYLQELLVGAPDIPVKLYDSLKPIMDAQGTLLEYSDLFFPDTSYSAPKDLPFKELDEASYNSYIAEQRLAYQKAFLSWLQSKQNSALQVMSETVSSVGQVQVKNANKTLWWSATAFVEALEQAGLAENQGAKRLCRKIDQELRNISEGQVKPHNQLLRDILYYVAISEPTKDIIRDVKKTFDLDALIDKTPAASTRTSTTDVDDVAVVAELTALYDGLKEIWDEVSNSINFNLFDATDAAAKVDVDNVLITRFADALAPNHALSQQLHQVVVSDYYNAMLKAASTMSTNAEVVNHAALIEIAASLNLLETSLKHYQNLDADRVQKLLSEISRLEAISSGLGYEKLESHRTDELDRDTLEVVMNYAKESLKVVEQALDTFFRNPADKNALVLTFKPLKQVSSVFEMLGLETPAAILNATAQLMPHFQKADYVADQQQFEQLAESLSMVGIYADEMPKVRPESERALESALTELNAILATLPVDETTQIDSESSETQHTTEQAELPTAVDMSDEPKVTDQAYDPELLDIYLTEAEEVLAQIAQNLQALRVNPTDDEALLEARRGFHTLKGSGRTVGLSALGEIAGNVEFFLNGIRDKKQHLNLSQISAIEQVASTFAGWAAELRAHQSVEVPQAAWIARIEQFHSVGAEADEENAENHAKESAYVLIGGTRKLSRALYDIFINESMRNITILEQDVAKVAEGKQVQPSGQAKHAAHTMASNALAADFKQMGELCRALENWLDEIDAIWTPKHFELYQNTVDSLSGMWQKVSEQKTPRGAPALIKVLELATQQAIQNKELTVDLANADIDDDLLPEEASARAELTQAVVEITSDVADNQAPAVEVTATLDSIPPALLSVEPIESESKAVETPQKPEKSKKTKAQLAKVDLPTIESDDSASVKPSVNTQALATEVATTQDGFGSGLDDTGVDAELLNLFIEESRILLPEINKSLRAWRNDPQDNSQPDALQRALHTLKGSARMAGQADLGDTVHELEEQVVRALKRKEGLPDFESMFDELDKIGHYFDRTSEPSLEAASTDESVEQDQNQNRIIDRKAQFLRMRADTLDRLINDAGEISIIRSRMDRELSGFKHASQDLTESLTRLRTYLRELEIEAETQLQSRMSILQEANETFDPLEFDRFTRLQELTRMIAESVNDVATIQSGLLSNLGQTEAALQQQNRMNRDLQQSLLSVRMLPFSQVSARMQRIVRQTARELNKSADLVIEGEETEIDRSMLDQLSAPLEHLLRNAVAHGIELPAIRQKAGKPTMGQVLLKLSQRNDEIQLRITDDGAGVDLQRVKQTAINNQMIPADADLSDQAIMSLIFEPGFSTADSVSQIAGRGVGLDVVRNDISGLGGRIDLTSESGKGTDFNVYLPVTLTIAQSLLVRTGTTIYALPVTMIEQAQKIKRQDLINAYQVGEIQWAGNQYPLHDLGKLLDHQDHQPEDHAYTSVLLLRSANHQIALHVDEVIGNQEIVIKPIGVQLARVPGVAGATVLGDGSVVLIINPVLLANREILSANTVVVKAPVAKAPKVVKKHVVMVVDDSLTMRKVLGRLLEREGFDVVVAKDGMDAMQILQETTPDAILTDIEMPRMDGFGLSRNIRDDARTARTPLVMISSRTADKHQNLAKEIGVDAFFGKPVNDEDLVLEVRRLIKERS
jgi:chemosensory pili system protein ChpA (sensor histidine kinase/response regulator)